MYRPTDLVLTLASMFNYIVTMPLPYVLLLWEKEYLKPPNMHLYMIWNRHSMIYCSCASCDEKSLPIIPHPGSRWNRWPAPLYPWWPGCSLVMCLQRSGREKHGEARWHPWGQRSMTFLSVCHFKTKAQTRAHTLKSWML